MSARPSTRPVINSFFWSFLEQSGSKIVSMIVQIVLARLLTSEAFGFLAVLLVVTNVADSIAQSGFGMALIQKDDATDESYDTAFWLSMGIAAVLYVLIFLLAPSLAVFYGMPGLTACLRVLSLVVLFNAANSIQRSWMQRRMDFKGLFRVSLITVLCSGAVGIGAALANLGVWALIAQTLSQSVLMCLVMTFLVPWRPRLRLSYVQAAELYGYGWKVCITGILNVFYTGVSELILGKACSAEELGYYSQGRKYPGAAIGVASNAIANVLFPALVDVKGNETRLRARIRKGLTLGTFAIAPLSMLATAVAKPVVAILLGEAWLPCVPIFALACAGNAVTMLQLVNLRAYMALGRSDLYMHLQMAKVALGIVGIGGAAFATRNIYATAWATFAVGIVSVLVIDMAPAAKVHGYGRAAQLRDVVPTLTASAAAYIVAASVTLLGLSYALELLTQCFVYTAAFLALANLLHIPELSEVLARVRSLLRGHVR